MMIGVVKPIMTVDATSLTDASSYRGIGTYLREVLRGLATDDRLTTRALVTSADVVPDGVTAVPIRRWAPGRYRAREHELRLPLDLRRAGGDVVWSPGQSPPRRSRRPFVQTLHDVTPLVRPDDTNVRAQEQLRRLAPRYRAAARWIANSAYTADSCAEVLGLPRDRITVAHLAAGPRYVPAPARRDPADPYVLYVGEYGGQKGFAEAFAVVAELAARGLPHRLRMVGRIAPWWRPTVEGLRDAAPRPDLVDLAGFVDDVVAAYQGADALLMTSRHEGFGLPLVEAMACAVPVVAFANSSLPEVVGDGGLLVPDGDVGAMADALVPILGDRAAWSAASGRALARSVAFDWQATATAHADVFLDVVPAQR